MTTSYRAWFLWLEAVLAERGLSPSQKVVLARLALYRNLKTGRCCPAVKTIAANSGRCERAVQAALARAEALGWIDRHIGVGRGNTTSYGFTIPDAVEKKVHSGTPFRDNERVRRSAQKGAQERPKGCTAVHPNTEEHEINSQPIADQDFDAWYSAYPRHVGRGQARRAYERVTKVGKATVEELLEGAKRYAAERAGKDPSFTKHPATWLNGECWADEPAAGWTEPQPPLPKVAAGGGWTL